MRLPSGHHLGLGPQALHRIKKKLDQDLDYVEHIDDDERNGTRFPSVDLHQSSKLQPSARFISDDLMFGQGPAREQLLRTVLIILTFPDLRARLDKKKRPQGSIY